MKLCETVCAPFKVIDMFGTCLFIYNLQLDLWFQILRKDVECRTFSERESVLSRPVSLERYENEYIEQMILLVNK